MLVETSLHIKFEYYFACTRQGVHLCFVISPDKMIFAVFRAMTVALQWVSNW